MSTSTKAIILIIICTILTATAQIFFKFGSRTFSFNILSLIQNYFVIIGFICYALGALLFVLALKGGDLSTLYPFFATSYIWVMMLSFFIFGEIINLLKIMGILLIIFGVCFIGFGGKNE